MSTITNPLFRLLLLSAFLLMKQLHQFLEVVSEVVMEAPLGLPLSQLSSQQQLSLPPRRKGLSSVPKLGSTTCKRSYLEGMAVFSNLFAPSGCFLCVLQSIKYAYLYDYLFFEKMSPCMALLKTVRLLISGKKLRIGHIC